MAPILRESPGMIKSCVDKMRYEGLDSLPQELDACYEMLPPMRWSGLWRTDFEGSRFCPRPEKYCAEWSSGDRIWLTPSKDPAFSNVRYVGNLYVTEFIGRRTRVRGFYGHMGMSQHEMIVDRLIALTKLEENSSAPH